MDKRPKGHEYRSHKNGYSHQRHGEAGSWQLHPSDVWQNLKRAKGNHYQNKGGSTQPKKVKDRLAFWHGHQMINKIDADVIVVS